MADVFEVTVPVRAVSVANLREHWAKKAARARVHRLATYNHLRLMFGPDRSWADRKIVVKLTRIGRRTLDDDNLASALKAARDGVADFLGRDDGDPLIDWKCAQERGGYAVRIRIEC